MKNKHTLRDENTGKFKKTPKYSVELIEKDSLAYHIDASSLKELISKIKEVCSYYEV